MTAHINIQPHETTTAPAGNVLIRRPDSIHAGSWQRVTVATLRSGQPRPYADSVYEAEICFEGGTSSMVRGYDLPFGRKPAESVVRKYARLMVRDYKDKDDPVATWASGRLEELTVVEEGPGYSIWKVRIVEPYTD